MPWTTIGLRLGEPKQACLNLEPSCPEQRPALHIPAYWTGFGMVGTARRRGLSILIHCLGRLDRMRSFSSNVW